MATRSSDVEGWFPRRRARGAWHRGGVQSAVRSEAEVTAKEAPGPAWPFVPKIALFGNRARADRVFFRRRMRLKLMRTWQACSKATKERFRNVFFPVPNLPGNLLPKAFLPHPVSCRSRHTSSLAAL